MLLYYKIAVFILFLLCVCSPALADYCVAQGSSSNADPHIISVIMDPIVNTDTQNDGYSCYSIQYATLSPGLSLELLVSLYFTQNTKVGIWVDWNQDFSFDGPNETIAIFDATEAFFRKTIAAPENAVSGFCRMRIRVSWIKEPTQCGEIAGEVEDYSIYVEGQSPYSGGMGTIEDPHLISTPQDLNEISSYPLHWNQHFLLTNDVDMSQLAGSFKNPIGNSNTKFTGIFDGNSYVIHNFTYNALGGSFVALFGYVDSDLAQIKNLHLANPNIPAAGYFVSSLVGVLGTNGQPLIQNCSVKGGLIAGTDYVGGLVGQAISGQIINCYADTSVLASGNTAGGFVAFTGSSSTITNSYSTSTVQCQNTAGGFVGTYSGLITTCYSAGFVSLGTFTGGFAGSSLGGTIQNCFWNTQTSNQTTSPAATGLDTHLMQTQSTYTNAGWDFMDTWHICEQTDYPKLRWQILSADIACPYGVNIEDILAISDNWLLTKLSYDTNSDGIVNFIDFADFAKTYNPQNISALYDFCSQWLQLSLTAGDIAPSQLSDEQVNFLDLATLAEQWLDDIK